MSRKTAIFTEHLPPNVLLSFAHFEHELTGERMRDEIAASKGKVDGRPACARLQNTQRAING